MPTALRTSPYLASSWQMCFFNQSVEKVNYRDAQRESACVVLRLEIGHLVDERLVHRLVSFQLGDSCFG